MSYEEIPIPGELAEQVRRAVGLEPRRHETLGELATGLAKERGAPRIEGLVGENPTCHEVEVQGQTFYTHCFLDALMLPFVLGGEPVEVRSASPEKDGKVTALATEEGVEAAPPDAMVSFGASRAARGEAHITLCPYLNAFPSLAEYERWAESHPEAVTVALSMGHAFALGRAWAGGTEAPAGEACC